MMNRMATIRTKLEAAMPPMIPALWSKEVDGKADGTNKSHTIIMEQGPL